MGVLLEKMVPDRYFFQVHTMDLRTVQPKIINREIKILSRNHQHFNVSDT